MNYSPLTIYCASLCLDVVQSNNFNKLTTQDILSFEDEIFEMVIERVLFSCKKEERESLLAKALSRCLVVLMLDFRCKVGITDTNIVLNKIQGVIEEKLISQ